ncbi:GTP 3',8-cyclase MoaA [Alkalihalobacterium elongatum]|uniref:GTP 3',8-cyclase MoaA n=1 Tax=Alkalihalobacterium elongatum TaxID=2675466 RepID=UPI001C1FEDA1|nr:GTP 3',8-cyclase MoaA [Alkalihalobacterium elongatum]
MNLVDRFDRKHDYLRISVTDRCNLLCHYCVPNGSHDCTSFQNLLTDDEIVNIVSAGAQLGIKKVRITGGEPLVRKGLPQLIGRLNEIRGIEDIALTTNGIFLAKYAKALKEAGLNRINISLDTLNEKKYRKITRNGHLKDVLEGIQAAIDYNLKPIKINVVLIKDYNVDEVETFLRWTQNENIQIRFIEYMPIGNQQSEWAKQYQSLSIVEVIARKMGQYTEHEKQQLAGPARIFSFKGAKGSFGLIHPISNEFCASCNRLRLTADGHLKSCLFWEAEVPIKPIANDPSLLIEAYKRALFLKPKNHEMGQVMYEQGAPTTRAMSAIGG